MQISIHEEMSVIRGLYRHLDRVGSKELARQLRCAAATWRANLPSGLLTNYYDRPPASIADMVEAFGQSLGNLNLPPLADQNAQIEPLAHALQARIATLETIVVPAAQMIADACSCLGYGLCTGNTDLGASDLAGEDRCGIHIKSRAACLLELISSSIECGLLSEFVAGLRQLAATMREDLELIAFFNGGRSGSYPLRLRILQPGGFKEVAGLLENYAHSESEIAEVIQAAITAGQNLLDAYVDSDRQQQVTRKALASIANQLQFDIYQLSSFANEHGVTSC